MKHTTLLVRSEHFCSSVSHFTACGHSEFISVCSLHAIPPSACFFGGFSLWRRDYTERHIGSSHIFFLSSSYILTLAQDSQGHFNKSPCRCAYFLRIKQTTRANICSKWLSPILIETRNIQLRTLSLKKLIQIIACICIAI